MLFLVYLVIIYTLANEESEAKDTTEKGGTGRQVEKKILDDILGSKAYDPRIRPPGSQSTKVLQEIFCHRDLSTWSWKQCEFTKSNQSNFSKILFYFVQDTIIYD